MAVAPFPTRAVQGTYASGEAKLGVHVRQLLHFIPYWAAAGTRSYSIPQQLGKNAASNSRTFLWTSSTLTPTWSTPAVAQLFQRAGNLRIFGDPLYTHLPGLKVKVVRHNFVSDSFVHLVRCSLNSSSVQTGEGRRRGLESRARVPAELFHNCQQINMWFLRQSYRASVLCRHESSAEAQEPPPHRGARLHNFSQLSTDRPIAVGRAKRVAGRCAGRRIGTA